MRCLLFPGQGAQRTGMGVDLFDRFEDVVNAASEILGYPVDELCRDDDGRLRDTRFAQPAIFLVNALSALARAADATNQYDYYAGHSLGEYNALVAGGYLDLYEALAVVEKRAKLMSAVTGGMAAVLGPPSQVVRQALRRSGLSDVYIANRNADKQTTIAGDQSQLQEATHALSQLDGTRVVPLNVSGPFHTPLMESAAAELAEVLGRCTFKQGHTTVISSVTGGRFEPDQAVEILSRQVAAPVEWVRTIRSLRDEGVTDFDEVNGRTLVSLLEGIR